MKRIISLVLSVVILAMALPFSFGASALDITTGEADGKSYVLGEVLYSNDFENETVGAIAEGWEASNTTWGWNSNGTGSAKITENNTYGKVLTITSTNQDYWVSMPEIKTRNYVYEARLITVSDCSSGAIGIANGMYGGIKSAGGATFTALYIQKLEGAYYRSKGTPTVERFEFTRPSKDIRYGKNEYKIKFVCFDGINYLYIDDTFIGALPQGNSDNTSDWAGFYVCGGTHNVTNVTVTEIITPKVEFNNVSLIAEDKVALNVDLSFDKTNKVYKNAITGKYSYSDNSAIKFGMVYATSDSATVKNITVNDNGVTDVLFKQNQETYERLYFSEKIADIESENLDKFYEIRPYVLINSQYIYGESRSYSPAGLANNIYSISNDKIKEKLSVLFKDSNVFKGENKMSLTFTMFSDFHYEQDKYIGSMKDLRQILARADESGSAFVMSGGDFCNNFIGSPELTNTYLNYKKKDGSILSAYNVYGNHELESANNSMEYVTPTLTNNKNVIWGTTDGSMDKNIGYYYFEENGFRIVCIDTNYSKNPTTGEWEHNKTASYGPPSGNTSSNSMGDVQLAWFENVLTDAANKGIPCIVVGHAGFSGKFATSSADAATVREIYAKVNAIKEGTVIMSINGHEHTNNQGYVDGVFYFDTNTVFNGRWVEMNGSSYHYSGLTYWYENYDDEGNLIEAYDRPITDLYQGRNTYFFEDPLSAVITVDEFGTITVDGMETTWKHNVVPTNLPAGKMPCITSGTFWDGESLGHVWSEEWDSNDTHHWHTCTNGSCTATDISLNYGYETHTFEEKDGKKVCVCGAVQEISNEEIPEETVKVWDGSIADSYAGGTGTDTDPYLIETASQLARMIGYDVLTNYTGNTSNGSKDKYYKLTNDIYLNDVSDVEWYKGSNLNYWYHSDASRFCGNLNGDGYTVYGLCFAEGAKYAGLIPFLDSYGANRTVENVNVSHSYIKGNYAGGILGRGQGANSKTMYFKNCYIDDTVIVEGTLTNSSNNYPYAGGFVGYSSTGNATIYNFSNCASLAKNSDGTALKYGFIGMNATWYMELYYTINNSFAYGILQQGVTSKATVNNCYLIKTPEALEIIKGEAAKTTMPNLDWANTWMVNPFGGYPVFKKEIVCTNHIYGDWTTEFEATVYDKGVNVRSCSICGKQEIMETEKLTTEISSVKLLGATRILLNENERIMHSVDGVNWKYGNVVTGLKPNTQYTIYVKRENAITGRLSGSSEALNVTTIEDESVLGGMNATELSKLRNMISDNESAFWADVNGDVIVDVKDIVRAKKVTAGLYDNYDKGDINEDGIVNDKDAQLLSDYLDGKIANIPVYNADVNGDGVLTLDDIRKK